MRIRSIRIDEVEVPFRVPFSSAGSVWQARRLGLVRLEGDDGLAGCGEIALQSPGGLPVPVLDHLLAELRGLDVAHSAALDRLLAQVEQIRVVGRPIRAAVETAVLDLLTTAAGRPFARGLAERNRPLVRVNGLVGLESPEESAAQAAGLVAQGYRTIKLKIGPERTAEALVERVEAVRSAVGPEVDLRLDANGAWLDEETAVARLRALAPSRPEYVEQPVPAFLGAGALARIRRAAPVPIAADEAVTDPDAAGRLLLEGAADVLVIKPSRVGGPREGRRIVEVAAELGVDVVVSTLFEAGIGLAAALHLASTVPVERAHGLATADLLVSDLLVDGPRVADGALSVPGSPGLGVRLDEPAIAGYRVE